MTEQQAQQISDQLESIRRMYHKECRLHAATKAELAEARKDGERLDWLARRTHWVDERMHLGLRGAIDAARGAK
jgi:hypothetical protein